MEGSYGMFNPTTDAKKEEGGPQKPQRRMPGRGVLDGIRQDLKASWFVCQCDCKSTA